MKICSAILELLHVDGMGRQMERVKLIDAFLQLCECAQLLSLILGQNFFGH